MKQLDSIDSLNAIRQKVTTRQTDFNQKELLLLEEVYSEIQEKFVGKKNVTLDKGCSSCISSAANIVFNYINFYEPKQIEIEKPIPVEDVEVVLEEIGAIKIDYSKVLDPSSDKKENTKVIELPGSKELKDMKLKDLRKLHPNIKARSVEEFIHELKQSQNGTSDENIQD